ncbi:MAG: hypothetical protein HY924_17440 [Elusimicrobia bacterium]|nr:hypothetical protein [Elusimicrobiota bacterium]
MDLFFADASGLHPPFPWGSRGSDILVLCPDDVTLWRCGSLGLKGVLADEEVPFIGPGSWDSVVGHCARLARSWRLDAEGRDFTLYKGTSLGYLMEGLVWGVTFGRLYKFADTALRLAREHRPQTAWLASGLHAHKKALVESLCRSEGIRLERLRPGPPACRDPRLTSDFCSWPLMQHRWKRRILNLGRGRPRAGRKRVLASSYYTIEPLIAALGAEKDIDPVFYNWPGRRLIGMPGWRRWRFLTSPKDSGLGADGTTRLKEMLSRFQEVSSSRRYQSRFELEGLDCWEAARPRLSRIVSEDFPVLADALERLSAALDEEKPDLVLVPYDGSPPERLLIDLARQRGIPSALMLHGISAIPRPGIEDIGADHLLVWGPALADAYVEMGFPRDRITATGYPMLDVLARDARRPRPAGRPVRVLCVSSCGPIEPTFGTALDILRSFPGIEVTLKLHPGESPEPYSKVLAKRLDGRCRLEWRKPMADLLLDADLVVSPPSGAVFEALALGIPVVLLNLAGLRLPPPYSGNWGLDPVCSASALKARLEELLPDRVPRSVDHSRVLEAFIGKPDGGCARRAIDVLRSLMNKEAPTS